MTLDQWIVMGEVGISAKTMWAAIKGVTDGGKKGGFGPRYDVPYDADDFRRCLLFVQQCNVTDDQLQKVKEVFPWWAPFIDNWDALVELYHNHDLRHDLYKRIQELETESKKLAGWKKTGPGSWKLENKQDTKV